jgi:hypothetical protein
MTTAIIIPLYRPESRHLLLLKSVLSASEFLSDTVIYVASDGSQGDVMWPNGSIHRLLIVAESLNIEMQIFSFINNVGYPRCFQMLMDYAITHSKPSLFHFIDQDDYCLSNRFQNRSLVSTQASSYLVVNDSFSTLVRHEIISEKKAAVLEVPAPGMTYSVPGYIITSYLNLCISNKVAANTAHDFVISQISNKLGKLITIPSVSMLYIQHVNNLSGYPTRLRWIYKKITNPKAVLSRTLRHIELISLIYDNKLWTHQNRLHHSKFVSLIYKIMIRIF